MAMNKKAILERVSQANRQSEETWRRSMSSEATAGQTPDQYGQLHPVETEELLARKQVEFHEEIQKLPSKDRQGLIQAEEKCPELLTDKFKLMFLRAEVFNADLAAKRYAAYWNKRIEIFGPEKAFQPLTLDKALQDDWKSVTYGYIQLLPSVRDPMGRCIVFGDPSVLKPNEYDRHSMVRSLWYHMHVALEESEDTQKHGIIMLMYPHNAQLSQFDRELGKMNMGSIQGILPLRMSAIHIIQPPKFFKVILVFARLIMSKRTMKRMLFHFGSQQQVLEKLASYGLEKNVLPTEVGGTLEIDVVKWAEGRRSNGN